MDITQATGTYGYLVVGLIVGLEYLGIPLPGETTLVAASVYAGATHHLNIAGVIAAAMAGAILGDTAGYAIGHWGGYRVLVRFGHLIRLHQSRVKVARYLFKRQGGKVVFLARFIVILRTYAAFLAGTLRMSWSRFMVFNVLGGAVWATAYGVAGYFAGNAVVRIGGILAGVFGAVAVLVLITLGVVLRRREEGLTGAAEREFPGVLDGYGGGAEPP